ncbi:MAG TPA: hypothetical protein VJ944_02330 [Thermoplasmataceae archaeon]|nr:hypothetical protein [Thermoplasmataceae archaeon]
MKDDGTLSASEISEYSFCSVAWYMDSNGYPRSTISSKRMENGRKMHKKLEPRYKRVSIAARLSIAAIVLLSIILVAFAAGLI